jgi:ketosteroid isomerase-like protein
MAPSRDARVGEREGHLDGAHGRIAQSLWSAVADGDADAVRELLTDDIVWHSVGRHPLAGEHRGREAVVDFLASLGERSEQLVVTLDDVFVGESGAIISYHGTVRRLDREMDMKYLLRLRIREGKICHVTSVPLDQRVSDEFWS